MKPWLLLLTILLVGVFQLSAEARPLDPGRLQVTEARVATAKQLVERSSLIVHVRTDGTYQAHATRKRIGNAKLVNYVQTLEVLEVWKGQAPKNIRYLSTGVEPLPDANDPLNDRYPGPLAQGEYVAFLHRVNQSDFYALTGIWQGLYPVHEGKTVALKRFGYAEFDQLKPNQVKQQLDRLGRQ